MKLSAITFILIVGLVAAGKSSGKNSGKNSDKAPAPNKKKSSINVSLGPRPYVLVESMKPSDLKTKLGTY